MRFLLYFVVTYIGSWSLALWSLSLLPLTEGLNAVIFIYTLSAIFGAVLGAFIVDTVVESLGLTKKFRRQMRDDGIDARDSHIVKQTLRIPDFSVVVVSAMYSLLGAVLWVIIGYLISHPVIFVGNAPDFITIGAATGAVIGYWGV